MGYHKVAFFFGFKTTITVFKDTMSINLILFKSDYLAK